MRIRALVLAAALAGTLAVGGCGGTTGGDRAGKLLTMAAEEAGFIDSLQDRLTRQLNIADLQIQMGQKDQANKTLALAVKTLQSEESGADGKKRPLDHVKRIAGWTSLAQLSHRAGNDGEGSKAYIEAVEALRSMEPEAKRAEYVLSLSRVAEELKGKDEAARLLVDGGTWAGKITTSDLRRFAMTTFAMQLVRYDKLDEARAVMKNEADAAWRADTLAAIARSGAVMEDKTQTVAFAGKAARSTAAASAPSQAASIFNKDVNYENAYRKVDLQTGLVPNINEPR